MSRIEGGSRSGLRRLPLKWVTVRTGSDDRSLNVVPCIGSTTTVRPGRLLLPLSTMRGWYMCTPVGTLAANSGNWSVILDLKHVENLMKLASIRVRSSHPHQLIPENYQDLCLSFTLFDAEKAARNFDIPEMIQAIFYAIVVNDAFELGIMSMDMALGP
ncbi:hypothetical protein Cgig2_002641 [Carnegiea gigantea]|uniref:Uncharacterized protein n=1 Tax=Carnegiea gigantea TaxID=171969 RepID=A0A9Q1JHL2_9CARY|nr:hypothetical protein Cgig2_002641 [Carnegiea gigantea]